MINNPSSPSLVKSAFSAAETWQSWQWGPSLSASGQEVTFHLWAPTAREVSLVLCDNRDGSPQKVLSMKPASDEPGWYRLTTDQARAGSLYLFEIDRHLRMPDPASRYQPFDVHGPSQVVDFKPLTRLNAAWTGRPWHEAIIYELHVGTFTPSGTFLGVIEKLDYLKSLGVTAIELMPLADFPGKRNWGYDGVLPFAPDSSYGSPADLVALIQAAHERDLMVFLDVVYNHFGPEGNYLHTYAQSFFTDRHHTPWGAALNMAEPNVRRFFIENAVFWLKTYGFDGLRLDAVHAIMDDSKLHFLDELASTVRHFGPQDRFIHLVLENDDNAVRYFSAANRAGYDAQWNDDFHHAAHVLLTGEASGYYEDYTKAQSGFSPVEHLARCLAKGFTYQGQGSAYRNGESRGEPSATYSPLHFVNFLQNHDQIGNRALGERLSQLAKPEALRAITACLLLSPSVPLLFMGEEWQSKTPFLFFCDFEPELAEKVRIGRRSEFARFPEFSNPEQQAKIPDPVAVETFQQSHLDWQNQQSTQGKTIWEFYRDLLQVRQTDLCPLLTQLMPLNGHYGEYEVFETTGLQLRWPLADGSRLQLTAQLAEGALTLPMSIADNLSKDGLQLIYASDVYFHANLEAGRLPGWSVVCQIG